MGRLRGNILVGPQVLGAMGRAFESAPGELAEKVFAALKAGDATGGDARGFGIKLQQNSLSARHAAVIQFCWITCSG